MWLACTSCAIKMWIFSSLMQFGLLQLIVLKELDHRQIIGDIAIIVVPHFYGFMT